MLGKTEKYADKSICCVCRLGPFKPRHMPSAISRLRALAHCVLPCSLLTTWLGKPVDVVASLGTHMALVCLYSPMVEQRANQTSPAFAAHVECNVNSRKLQSQSVRSLKIEVSILLFFCFRNLSNFGFSDFAFSIFDSVIAAPLPGRGTNRVKR
jgi:hypothetical protein